MTFTDGTDVLVVGGGLVGTAVAERLARERIPCTLVERGTVGAEASWAAAGLLVPVHPWKYPAPLLALDDESLRLWEPLAARLLEETGVDVEFRRTGLLSLVESDDDEAEAERRAGWLRARGRTVERLDGDTARREEPLLSPRVRGALFLPDVAQIRNHRAAPALAAAASRLGARILEHTTVLSLVEEEGRICGARTDAGTIGAQTVVLCAGAWSTSLLPPGHVPPALRIVPSRGQMMLLPAAPGALRHMVLGSGDYLVPRRDGRILAGSTVEHVGFDRSVTPGGLAQIGAAVARMTPALAQARIERTWAGLRPDTPDHLPVLGEVRPGLLAATGHFRSGVMLAPVTGEIVLELLRGGSQRDLSPFLPWRD